MLLSVRDLTVEFHTDDGIVHAVSDLSYDLFPGETLAVAGEVIGEVALFSARLG